MHLGRGRRGERLVVDRGVQLLRGLAQLPLDHVPGFLPGEGGRVALQLRQLLDELRRQGVTAARDHLADLHVGRAELLEQDAEALGPRPGLDHVRLAEDLVREPAADPADRRVAQRRVERLRVDQVVDLLQAQVLEDEVAVRRGQRLERPPDLVGPARQAQPRAVEAEHGIQHPAEDRVQGGEHQEPQPRRLRDLRDVGGDERGHPDDQRIHDDEEQTHRGQQQAAREGHDHGANEALAEDEDRSGDQQGDGPRARQLQDGRRLEPERERLCHREQAQEQDDHEDDDRVDDGLDDEAAHGFLSAQGRRAGPPALT